MTDDQALTDVLDETIDALSNLDLTRLYAAEQRILLLKGFSANEERDNIGVLLAKRRALGILLQNFQVNLDALTRLHARNVRKQWAQ
ncbi:MAG: hypothetical protein ABSA39_14885 [Edaphobacter sp.]